MLEKKPHTSIAMVQQQLAWSIARRMMNATSKCVKAAKRPLLTEAASLCKMSLSHSYVPRFQGFARV